MCSALHPHTGTCDRTHTRQSPMRALPSHTERAVRRFFFPFFSLSMRLKSLMEWTARGSRGRGVGVGGQRSAESDEADDCACRNRRPEHQSGVSRWRSGRSGWKGQRVRWANKLIFVVVHAPSRAQALEPGLLQGKGRNSHRCPVAHSSGARVRRRTEGNSSAKELPTDRPRASSWIKRWRHHQAFWWWLIIDCHFLVGVMIYCM